MCLCSCFFRQLFANARHTNHTHTNTHTHTHTNTHTHTHSHTHTRTSICTLGLTCAFFAHRCLRVCMGVRAWAYVCVWNRYSLYQNKKQFSLIDSPWLSWEFTCEDEKGHLYAIFIYKCSMEHSWMCTASFMCRVAHAHAWRNKFVVMCICIYKCMYTYTHTYTHICIHIYIYTYMYIWIYI